MIQVLVDAENIRRTALATRADVEDLLWALGEFVEIVILPLDPDAADVELRLYGGWRDAAGAITPKGEWLLASLHLLRGIRQRIRFRPSVAFSIAKVPSVTLNGTFRRRGGKPIQKMVDIMIGLDVCLYAEEPSAFTVVLSNDEDLVPAFVAALQNKVDPLLWIRPGRTSAAPNDATLLRRGLLIADSDGI